MTTLDREVIVNDDKTNEGRRLLPTTLRGLFRKYVGEGNIDEARLLHVVVEAIAKAESGRIRVSAGLLLELKQVYAAIRRDTGDIIN